MKTPSRPLLAIAFALLAASGLAGGGGGSLPATQLPTVSWNTAFFPQAGPLRVQGEARREEPIFLPPTRESLEGSGFDVAPQPEDNGTDRARFEKDVTTYFAGVTGTLNGSGFAPEVTRLDQFVESLQLR